MQQIYAEPVKAELIVQRIREIKDAGVVRAASLTPQRTELYARPLLEAELDLFVIQGTVVSAEHVSKTAEPLNLKRFIREFEIPVIVGGCASYQAALHLMRTGAVGVLVGVGPGNACTTRASSASACPRPRPSPMRRRPDAAPRRDRRLRARHRRRWHVPGRGHRQGHRLRRRRGHVGLAAVLGRTRRPARGFHWGMATFHPTLPRGARVRPTSGARSQEILLGPAHENDGRMNLFGALRTAMATCGYQTVKEFQKAEVMVAPALQTEGKALQRSQGVGMGH